MKKAGIIGGLGPLAGAHFYKRLIELSPAQSDAEHLPVILISDSEIPSRVKHLSGFGESPLPKLQKVAADLETLGAELIAIPSSTTNLYREDIAASVGIPVISLVQAVTDALSSYGVQRVGLLGTTPTLRFRLYDDAFAEHGISTVHPDHASQEEIMEIIRVVKGANSSASIPPQDRILDISKRPWARGIDGLLLACTEIPVVFPVDRWDSDVRLLNATDILAAETIRKAE